MTIRTKTDIYSEINTKFADNAAGDISAGDLRSVVTDIFDTARWRSFTSLNVDTILDQGDHNGVIADDSLGNIVFTLPDNTSNSGAIFGVLKASSSTNTVTINSAGSDTINGDPAVVLDAFGEFITVASTGTGQWFIVNRNLPQFDAIEIDINATAHSYKAGQISYDADTKAHILDTGITGVRYNTGQELWTLIVNNSGAQIDNGQPVAETSTIDGVTKLKEVQLDSSSLDYSVNHPLGLATHDIADGSIGLITKHGRVRDIDTSAFSVGDEIYASSVAGVLTATRPVYPENIKSYGIVCDSHASTGCIDVAMHNGVRQVATKSEFFNSTSSGTYWINGFYDAPATDANLTQASTTQTYGSATNPYQAYAFVVCGGAGTVDTGVVGLRATGTTSSEDGTLTPADTEVLIADITALATNQYIETTKRFVGTVTFELYVVSGSPTTYSLNFNYGYSKYDDFWNTNFTMYGIEVVGEAGANDTGFEMELMYHKPTGWTYSATSFVPGNGTIATFSTDLGAFSDLSNGEPFAWKRTAINQLINGAVDEGFLFKITTTANNAVRNMTAHVAAFYE